MVSMLVMGIMAWSSEVDAGNLRLTWKDTSTNESGFKVERHSGGSFTEIATVGANVTSHTDSGVTTGTMYCYRVRAFNSAGTSSPSNQACANAKEPTTTVSIVGGTNGSTSGATSPGGSSSTGGSGSSSQVGSRWTDYRVTMKIRSSDNDTVGVMFRYVDDRNYYRFSWCPDCGFRGLEKIQNGVRTVLAQDTVRYAIGTTYQLQIVAQGPVLTVLVNGARVFSVTDSSFDRGTIALYSYYNGGSSFDDIVVQDLATGAVLLSENFNDGNFTGWTIIDEGDDQGPSVWSAGSRALVQTSNIGSQTIAALGTYAVYTKGSWTDYQVTLKMRSDDNDGIGLMFRYVDDKNYYRFSWSVQEGYRRLEKIQKGVPTVLARDSVRYTVGRTYQVEIIVRDSMLSVLVDEAQIFSVTDSSFDGGAIALYSNYNRGSVFNDVVVQDLATGALLLSENFNDSNFIGWTIINEATDQGPSVWSAKSGALVQSGNLGSYTSARLGTYALY